MKKFNLGLLVILQTLMINAQDLSQLDWWNDAVFYEIFVRSFYDSDGDGIGDFKGITQKMDYLNDGDPSTTSDLGITGIWLMPINPSPSYHGYDVTDYREVNPDYGTMDDFKEMLAAAHARGIRVIIDYVMNHSSSQHPWFLSANSSENSEYRDWYTWTDINPGISGPWGQNVWHTKGDDYYYGIFWSEMPDLNYNTPAVKEEMFAASRFWLEEIGIDGFRLDAVKYIYEDGNNLEDLEATHTFFADFTAFNKAINSNSLTVGEAWTTTDKVIPYVIDERIDFCFEFDFASAAIGAAASGNLTGLKEQLRKQLETYPYYQFGTFLTNHDQNRVMENLQDEEKVKVAASFYLTTPGVPFVYYGEEVGMLGSKPDENIRRPMHWADSRNAGFSSSNPWNAPASNYEENNVADMEIDEESLLNHYKRLIHLRNDHASLRTGDYTELANSNEAVFTFMRSNDQEQLVIAVNPTATNKRFDIDFSQYGHFSNQSIAIDELSGDYLASIINNEGDLEDIRMSPYQTLVLRFDEIAGILPLSDAQMNLYPNPSTGKVWARSDLFGSETFRSTVYSLDGKVLDSRELDKSNDQLISTELPPGIYLVNIQSERFGYQKRLLVR